MRDKKGLFELANRGTIFLDEISDLSPHLQVKLLRVLEEKVIRPLGGTESSSIDVRILSATNKNIEHEVSLGNFREDLFYRLNVIKIVLPPLRERKEDIPLLAMHFLNKYSKEMGKNIVGISPRALAILENYQYPGNVRELENIIARCVALESTNLIMPETLPNLIFSGNHTNVNDYYQSSANLDLMLESVEKQMLENALKTADGNKTEAARLLGISLRSLRYRLEKHGLFDEAFEINELHGEEIKRM